MELLPSAHVDTFCRDHLPPDDQWPELVFTLPELHYPDRLNAATALLDDVVARHGGDRPCLHQPGVPTWSYDELLAAANRVAHVLVEDLGIVPGNRVLLRGPNNQWLSAAWFGVLKAGAVAVTTMPLLRTGELQTIHEIAHLDAALVDHRFLDAVEPLGVPTLAFGDDAWLERVAAKPATFDDVLTSSDDVSMLAFTSGTTGRPKATMHFHRDVLAVCDTFSRHVLQPSPDDVFTGTPPFAFTFGLGGVLLFPLHAGASTLLVEKATPTELADLIDAPRRDGLLHRAHGVQGDARRSRQAAVEPAHGGLRRRAPAEGDLGGVPRRDRGRDHRRHRRDRDAAHLRLGRGRRHPAGLDRARGARLHARRSSTTTAASCRPASPGGWR